MTTNNQIGSPRARGRSTSVPQGAGFSVIDGGKQESSTPEPNAHAPGGAAQPYNEDMLLVAAFDRGQMEPVTFKIQEQYLAWGRLITESRRFPMLRTRSDIARLGWERVVAWLSSIDGDVAERSVMHQLAQMSVKVAWERRNLDYIKFIDEYAPILQEQLALPQGKLHAAKVLREMRRHMEAMEPSFYKSLFEKMFNDRFGAFEQAGLVLIEVAGEGEHSGAQPIEHTDTGGGNGGGADYADSGGAADMEEMLREIEDMIARGAQ